MKKIKMFSFLKEFSLINKIFNLKSDEFSSIPSIWFVRFLYRFGFVIGWTVIVTLFVGNYGIDSIPFLFIIVAVFSIISSVLYTVLISKFDKINLLISTIFITGFILLAAIKFEDSRTLSFALLITAIAFFMTQFKIILSSYTEEMFSPLQSERIFPLIEAADTLAGVLGGLLIYFLSEQISIYKFIYVWIAAIFMVVPIILLAYKRLEIEKLPKEKVSEKKSIFSEVKNELKHKHNFSFIKGLFLIVFVQWLIFNILEFKYTKALYSNVSNVLLEAGSGFEHAFIHDLSIYFTLFSFSALIIQLFLGGRFITFLGISGSLILHSVVTFLSFIGFLFSNQFLAALLVKNNFTMTSVIHNNAYHSSYYALNESIREHVRELLEGIIRPMGALVGMLLLIFLQYLFSDQILVYVIDSLMLISAIFAFYFAYRQRKHYTNVAISQVINSAEKHTRYVALDVLAQKGHGDVSSFLEKIVFDKKESLSVRAKALSTLAEISDEKAVEIAEKCLFSNELPIKENALFVIESYDFFKNKSLFLKYRIFKALKEIYKSEKDDLILKKIVRLMASLSSMSTVDFLMDELNIAHNQHKMEIIISLGKHDDDYIRELVENYLLSEDYRLAIGAAIVLYGNKKHRKASLKIINDLLKSEDKIKHGYALFAIGELRLKHLKRICYHHLTSSDKNSKKQAAIALLKMGIFDGIPTLIDIIFSHSNFEMDIKMIKYLLYGINSNLYRNFESSLREIVASKIETIISTNDIESLADLRYNDLIYLRYLYSLVNEYEEVELINEILSKKNNYVT